jgi:two-component system, sensor histidine kinase
MLKDDQEREIEKLKRINHALMGRVERSTDQQGSAYSLFTAAIELENQVLRRTAELNTALTRLEQTNDELTKARDGAERANEVKTRFFTAVGHDLLQPLHAARLSLSALDETNEPVERGRITTQIEHALSSIEDLLRTILDISKLATGAIQPEFQTVPLKDLFHSLKVDFGPVVLEKRLELRVLSNDLSVRTDPLLFRRILQNLMSNAVRYTVTGSIALTADRDGRDVLISVTDTGPGIEADEQERIFEEFQRGSALGVLPNDRGGFGLGLSIVQHMASALDHPMKLHSDLDQGSRFTIIAKHCENKSAAAKNDVTADPKASYALPPLKILVIDNDIRVLEAMQTLLNQWSCQARLVRTLEEVRDLIEREAYRPDMILADYHLERGTSGLAAVADMRNNWDPNLPAIVITADHAYETELCIRDAKCDVLRKPVRPAALRALISQLIKQSAS